MPAPIAPVPEKLPSAAREHVIDVLTRHFANDELTESDLEARFQAVYAAKTSGELDAIIADLPTTTAHAATEVRALFSGQERKLAGIVPRGLKLRARLGYVEMDLTKATFEPGVTTIDVRAFMVMCRSAYQPVFG